MKIINATPHDIHIVDHQGNQIAHFPKGDLCPRLKQETVQVGTLGGVPISETQFGETEGLPEEQEGTYYIVSRLVMSANPNRTDLLVPNEVVRNDTGQIIGSKSLARN